MPGAADPAATNQGAADVVRPFGLTCFAEGRHAARTALEPGVFSLLQEICISIDVDAIHTSCTWGEVLRL